jgi:polysaccharide biosynthesis transport protein
LITNGEQQQAARRISLRDVLFIFFYKLDVFETILLFIFVVTLGITLLKTPVYQVTSQILVKPLLESNLKLQAPAAANIRANPVTPQDVNSEVNILKSPQLLREVVNKLELFKEEEPTTLGERVERFLSETLKYYLTILGLTVPVPPEERALLNLEKRLEIKPITLSNSIEISLKGDSPEKITKIVNTLMESYIDYHINLFKAKGAKEFYTDQADFFKEKLKEAEDKLEQFKKQWSIIEINTQNETNVELLKIFRENLALTNAQIKDRQTKVDVQARNFSKTGDLGAFTKDFQNNILEEYIRTLGPLLAERERIAVHYQKDSVKYLSIQKQVEELNLKYDKQIKELLKGAQLDLNGLKNYAKTLQDNLNKVDKQSVILSQKQIELERLWREVKQNEKHYLLYLNKTEEARIEEKQESNRVSNVTVTNWAQKPATPVFPKKGLMIVLSLIVGSIVGLAGTFFSYYMDHAVKTPEELAWYSGLPVLATIRKEETEERQTRQEQSSEESLPVLWMLGPSNHQILLEDYHNLKNNLLLRKQHHGYKVFLFTGPEAGVGVSSAAFNLALLLADELIDQRILLVDTNLSDPALHRAFKKPSAPGLMEYLCNNEPLSQVVQELRSNYLGRPSFQTPLFLPEIDKVVQSTHLGNLDLITFGSRNAQILSPFDLKKFSTFIEEVRAKYDFVILDSPPVFSSSHSLIISDHVDGIIMVVEASRTRYEVVLEMKQRLERHGKTLGAVLNKRHFVIPAFVYRYI